MARKQLFNGVRIKTREEFDWLLEHLRHETFRARDHWELWTHYDKAVDEYWRELNRTPNFWTLTVQAYKDALILRLVRLYDPHPAAISLGNLLQTIKANAAKHPGIIPTPTLPLDDSELDREMLSVSDKQPTVSKLLTIRNEYLAHRGSKHVAKGTYVGLPGLDLNEIDELLKRAFEILQKYSERLGFLDLHWGNHQGQDFETLMELLRAARKTPA